MRILLAALITILPAASIAESTALPAKMICNVTKTKCVLVVEDGDRNILVPIPLLDLCGLKSA